MKVVLICSENIRKAIEEIIRNRNIKITNDSDICIIEKKYSLPKGKIGIYFDMDTLNILMQFLDDLVRPENYSKNIIMGRYNNNYAVITYDNILYFEGIGNDVFCFTKDKKYKIKEKLYELEENLRQKGFIRVSKGFIVNIVKAKEIIPWFNGKLLLKMEDSDEEIYVSRSYAKEFKNFLGF